MSTPHGAALVSGASRGLGAVIARRLAADGWPVAVNYRSELERDEAGHVVEDILARGGTAEAFAADITDEAAAAGLVSRAADQLGSIDVLVVNATGPQPVVPLVEAVLPGMKERGRGRIVQIGSDIFERAVPGMSAYVAAKGAQLGLTRSWARELGPFGITVHYVAPGWIPVERHAGASP